MYVNNHLSNQKNIMEYSVRKISENLYQINIIGQSSEENLMIKNISRSSAEDHYHIAVSRKLGPNASLLAIHNDNLFPFSVIGHVEFSIGLGGH